MALVKKKAVRSVVVPVKKKVVISPKPVAYEITTDINSDYSEVSITPSKGATASFNLGMEGTPFCCGLREIGSFSYNSSRAVPESEVIKGVAQMLEELLEDNASVRGEVLTILFTLVDSAPCDIVKAALKLRPELFTLVKTFVNSNSGRLNELYVSNT